MQFTHTMTWIQIFYEKNKLIFFHKNSFWVGAIALCAALRHMVQQCFGQTDSGLVVLYHPIILYPHISSKNIMTEFRIACHHSTLFCFCTASVYGINIKNTILCLSLYKHERKYHNAKTWPVNDLTCLWEHLQTNILDENASFSQNQFPCWLGLPI